jgi:hypothetical protein
MRSMMRSRSFQRACDSVEFVDDDGIAALETRSFSVLVCLQCFRRCVFSENKTDARFMQCVGLSVSLVPALRLVRSCTT